VAQPPGTPPPPSAAWTARAPTVPAWTPRAPKRHRRRWWIWLLVGAVGVIVALAVASGTLWVQKVKPPIDAANAYLRDLSHADYEAAFDRLCAADRVDASPESLARTADALRVNEYEVSPFNVNLDGSSATVKADLNPGRTGDSHRFVRIRMRKIDGEWRPCGGRFGFVLR
jgi:hypothetical protein